MIIRCTRNVERCTLLVTRPYVALPLVLFDVLFQYGHPPTLGLLPLPSLLPTLYHYRGTFHTASDITSSCTSSADDHRLASRFVPLPVPLI